MDVHPDSSVHAKLRLICMIWKVDLGYLAADRAAMYLIVSTSVCKLVAALLHNCAHTQHHEILEAGPAQTVFR